MTIDEFIARWTDREGGAERANYVMFLTELCELLGVPRPDPAGATSLYNDYVFERAVRPRDSADIHAPQRIDLYKRGCFILEAKQSRLAGARNDLTRQGSLPLDEPAQLGRRGTGARWDAMMRNARQQGERYVFLLDKSQPVPPFLLVCDVGHCLEIYADFSGTGRDYTHFPDRRGFRIYLEDLRTPELRERLKAIWTDPHSLDPTKNAARVTREIAKRLAEVSKALEGRKKNAEDVAHFLMRCLFTMFAEDVGLLPEESFKTLLEKSVADPTHFSHRLKSLWKHMDEGEDYSFVIDAHVRKFNGGLFKDTTVFDLEKEEIGELLAAAKYSWREVDPAIFGTLLEQAIAKDERRKLGAHYTPRTYVKRLVDVTVMEPLRDDWKAALTKIEQATDDGDEKRAIATGLAFHRQLCATRVLDPACGTGNFLYVALELMKTLEGEVLETLAKLGAKQTLGLEEVDPHRFLGLEINPRAAAIAELVIWIGYLQQHYRTRTGHPSEPILKDFKNINFGLRGGYDAVLTWNGYPLPKFVEKEGMSEATYPHARPPFWPEAEFIVGNPPFIRGSRFRSEFGGRYAEAIWAAYPRLSGGADFVTCWWDRAATMLSASKTLRRFGFVTTNKIAQGFSREVVVSHLTSKKPIYLVWAIDDHPWYRGPRDVAQVRIAMTVVERGRKQGRLLTTVSESGLDSDRPTISFEEKIGVINPDLTVGVDVFEAGSLRSNKDCCFDGIKLHGRGFVVGRTEARLLGLGTDPDVDKHIKPYKNGLDLRKKRPERMVIDMYGVSKEELLARYPKLYQHLLTVKRERQEVIDRIRQKGRDPSKDLLVYLDNWWLFGKPRPEMRPALEGLSRYIGTIDTARHRTFQFIEAEVLCDDKIVVIADDRALYLSLLSSRIHVLWATRAGGWLGVGNDPVYAKKRTFDPFPFPIVSGALSIDLSRAGEELDRCRKLVLGEHGDISITDLYEVIEKIKKNSPLTLKDQAIRDRGLVLVLRDLHEEIDRLTAAAYGWPTELSDEEILTRLVALNIDRAKEEASGTVRWLRPEYQVPRVDRQSVAKSGELDLSDAADQSAETELPAFPADRDEHPLAVERMLRAAGRPMSAAEIARGFKRGGRRVEQRVTQVLGTLVRYGRVTAAGDQFAA